MSRKVEIILGRDGSIKVEAIGFEGESCVDATKFLETLFGKAESVELKAEYYNETLNKDCLTNGLCG